MSNRIRKGLNLPITGEPLQKVAKANAVSSVALLGGDYVGLKPTMEVKEGQSVQAGELLFTDKKNPGVLYTSPASGVVTAINRGEQRSFQSLVIRPSGSDPGKSFKSYLFSELPTLSAQDVRANLIESGLWTAFRTRPFSKVPSIGSDPQALFINCMDTNPLAASAHVAIERYTREFHAGLQVLQRLIKTRLILTKGPTGNFLRDLPPNIKVETFTGPHPAGLVGTHMHYLAPVNATHINWHLNYQDVIAIGVLFTTGKLWGQRMISLAGPQVKSPRLLEVPLGASLMDLCQGELKEGPNRLISGSVLCGHHGHGPEAYLGRYHLQVSVIKEDHERVFLGWQAPGFNSFSIKNVFAAKMFLAKKFAMTSNAHGSHRAIVPIGSFESVMPLDIEPTALMKALASKDLELSEQLGALELDEEDLGLCNFVDPGKTDYGTYLREILTQIEKDG